MSSLVSNQRNTRNNPRNKGSRTPKHAPAEIDDVERPQHHIQADAALEWLRRTFVGDPGSLAVCEKYVTHWRECEVVHRGKFKLTRLAQTSKVMHAKYRGTNYASLIPYIEQVVVQSA